MGGFAINRSRPRVFLIGFKRFDQIPHFDRANVTTAVRFMMPVTLQFTIETAPGWGSWAEDAVHGLENLRRRAEGDGQIDRAELAASFTNAVLVTVMNSFENIGVGTLERIDRLLAIADHKHRARFWSMAAFAGKEFIRQCTDDFPLWRAGVLRLVNQQVLDAAVELVENPGGVGALLQQLAGLDDEIVEVITSLAALHHFVLRDDGRPEPECRQGCGYAIEITEAAQGFEQALLLRLAEILDPGEAPHRGRVGHPFPRFPCGRQEDFLKIK